MLAGRFRVEPLLVGKLPPSSRSCWAGPCWRSSSILPGLEPWVGPLLIMTASWSSLGRGLCACRGAHLVAGARRPLTLPTIFRTAISGGTSAFGRACQLVLDLPHAGRRGARRFPAGASPTVAALDAVLRWPAWPAPACLLIGPPGSGKTHLARIWARRAGAVFLRGIEVWAPADPLRRGWPTAAPASSTMPRTSADETLLFHLYNRLRERRRQPPADGHPAGGRLAARLPDLRSRLLTAWPVHIGPPDDELLAALLVKQLADRQMRADAEVVEFLVNRMERSFAAARAWYGRWTAPRCARVAR